MEEDTLIMDFSLYGFEGLKQVFNVHPAFVHFPIALLPTTLFFYAAGLWLRKPAWLLAGRICLYLSLASVAITVTSGLMAQDSFPHNEQIHHMMETHKHTGWIILGITVLLALWSFWRIEQKAAASWAFVILLGVAGYLVLQNGDIGSRMVYIQGAAVKPAVAVVSKGDEHHHASESMLQKEHHH